MCVSGGFRRVKFFAVLLAAGSTVFAGCSAQNYACPASIVAPPQLVYPVAGARNVPDGLASVIVSNGATSVSLVPPSGATLHSSTLTMVPTPLPTPNAEPSSLTTPSLLGLSAFAIGSLTPTTTYSVMIGYTESTCNDSTGSSQHAAEIDAGTFTTQ